MTEPFARARIHLYARSPLAELASRAEIEEGGPSSSSASLDCVFSSSDRQRIVWHVMTDAILANINFADCLHRGVFKRFTALHDAAEVSILQSSWVKRKAQPLDMVRDYFGSSIAFFFAFSAHYTNWMVPLALLGTLSFSYQVYRLFERSRFSVCCLYASIFLSVLLV